MQRKAFTGLLCVSLVLLATQLAVAHDEPEQPGPNVRVTVTIGEVDGDGRSTEKSYQLIVHPGNRGTELLTGWRVPIPTTTIPKPSGENGDGPITSFTYQNVGMTAQVRAWMVDEKRVRIGGSIEVSAVSLGVPGKPHDAPRIGTFSQQFQAVFTDGKPLRVAAVPDPDGGSRYIELQADLLE